MFAGHLGAALALGRVERRLNVGVLVAGALLLDAVLWLLILAGRESVRIPADFLSTHQPDLFGLGLWDDMRVALAVEAVVAALGAWLFLMNGPLARGRAIGVAALVAVTLAFTVAGMTVAPPPPSPFAMAASSLIAIAALTALVAWLGRPTQGRALT
jgi:hypothetical protein